MKFAEILEIRNGRNQRQVENKDGKYPIYRSGGIIGYADDYICDSETVVIGRKGNINNLIFVKESFWNVDTIFGLVTNLTKKGFLQVEMKVPSKEKQHEIVARLYKIVSTIVDKQHELYRLDLLVQFKGVGQIAKVVAE